MAIDGCSHSFQELTTHILPRYMAKLREAFLAPHRMGDFSIPGTGPKTILQRLGRSKDFAGCYVLLEEIRPIYVGISRSVISRLSQHVKGKTHFDASLAYRMTCARLPHTLERSQAMRDPAFVAVFNEIQAGLKRLNVAFVEIENDLELHLFEAYCAMELDCPWNSFRTH